ncbi:hypothetical protein O3J91_06500 [Yersinia pestis]|nr:hypothetical protein [Salmonella enterica]ECH4042267.1 hypothetical protein [Salmonella enterica]MDL0457404.1 hypothetical protein [Yersinia pestis]MDL1129137.1 hypothetical protein [Yersinia pestis]
MSDLIVFEGNEIRVSDYFVHIDGYEQTNVNFYQVVAVTGKSTVKIRAIKSWDICDQSGSMSGKSYPVIDSFLDENIIAKRLIKGENEPRIKIDDKRCTLHRNPYKGFRFSTYG